MLVYTLHATFYETMTVMYGQINTQKYRVTGRETDKK